VQPRDDRLATLVDELLTGGRPRPVPKPVLEALERIELARRGAGTELRAGELEA
jgi:hypothetical protein